MERDTFELDDRRRCLLQAWRFRARLPTAAVGTRVCLADSHYRLRGLVGR